MDGSRGEETPSVTTTPTPVRRPVILPPSRIIRHVRAAPAAPPPVVAASRPVVAAPPPVVAAPPPVVAASRPVVAASRPVRNAPVRKIAHHVTVSRQTPTHEPLLRVYDASIWGPPLWRILHKVAEVADTNTDWPALLTALRTCLPCPDCSRHYNAWVDEHEVSAGIVGGAKAWVLALHNDVNRRRGVAQWTPEMVSASVSTVRRRDLEALLRRINGKVGVEACRILTRMIGVVSA